MIKLPLLDPNPCAFACSHLCVSEPQSAICQAEMTWASRDYCLEAETEGSGHVPSPIPHLFGEAWVNASSLQEPVSPSVKWG